VANKFELGGRESSDFFSNAGLPDGLLSNKILGNFEGPL
jgi:hypothetical protein